MTADRPSTHPSTHAARVLLQALHALGVRDVVLAPGSRSAPLAHALAECAQGDGRDPAAPELRLHVRVDERGAGFLALGLARAAALSGPPRPVAVVTTSGTAVANLHPAVLEAHHAGLPLLVLSADRPHELRGTGANQTTDQVGLLAPAVRLTLDVPAPTGRPGEDRDVRHLAVRAVAAATGARTLHPGPVHLNLAFREPLTPGGAPWPEPEGRGLTGVVARRAAPHVALASGADGTGPRTVVVAGDGAGPDARRLAEARGWPLLAEPSSGARGGPAAVPAYRLVLAHEALGGAVERVVVLGRPTLSRPVQALLGRPDVEVLVVAPHGADWPDAPRAARRVVPDLATLVEALDGATGRGTATTPTGDGWSAAWRAAGRAVRTAVAEVARAGPVLTGPEVAAAVAAAVPAGAPLVVGSSNPVRDLDLVADWDEPPLVLANRGLAGIDGTLATASGVALGLGRPVHALVGDLTFLHDAGSLLVGPLEQRPDLRVVVANDDGGSIFAALEHGEAAHADAFERVFATPTGADLAALCAGYGVRHTRVRTRGELDAALTATPDGVEVVEAVVDRAGRRALGEAMARAAAAALAGS